MNLTQAFFLLAVGGFTLTAALIDMRWRRLPNWLNVAALVAALVAHTVISGLSGLGFALLGFITGFGILFVLWLIGGGGGGDVKYMGALGAWLGVELTVAVLVLSGVFAVVAGARVLVWQFCRLGPAGVKKRFLSSGNGRTSRGGTRRKKRTQQERTVSRRLMPFAVPAGLATWCVLIASEFILEK